MNLLRFLISLSCFCLIQCIHSNSESIVLVAHQSTPISTSSTITPTPNPADPSKRALQDLSQNKSNDLSHSLLSSESKFHLTELRIQLQTSDSNSTSPYIISRDLEPVYLDSPSSPSSSSDDLQNSNSDSQDPSSSWRLKHLSFLNASTSRDSVSLADRDSKPSLRLLASFERETRKDGVYLPNIETLLKSWQIDLKKDEVSDAFSKLECRRLSNDGKVSKEQKNPRLDWVSIV